MTRRLPLQVFIMAAGVLFGTVFKVSLAQSVNRADDIRTAALIAKAPTLTYPEVARMAHVTGDVDLTLGVRQDGTVESAVVIGGPFLLRQAALNNARGSQFDCSGCSEPVTQYSLVYTFQLTEKDDPCAVTEPAVGNNQRKAYPQVMRSPGHVTLIDQTASYCDPTAETGRRVRAAKCLYLWKCGIHWSTSDAESKKSGKGQ
jgi:Gram-negative bacterial TonB protein C-terminal